MAGKGSWMVVWNLKVAPVEAMLSMIILMMPKTQVKNQESSKFQESKSRSIKNQDSSKESREDSIKISIKRVFQNIE